VVYYKDDIDSDNNNAPLPYFLEKSVVSNDRSVLSELVGSASDDSGSTSNKLSLAT